MLSRGIFSYRIPLILSRAQRGVERTLGIGILALHPAIFSACADFALAADEPIPSPQSHLLQSYDLSEARALIAKQKWPEAAIVLRSAYRVNPSSLPVAIQLATALAYSGRREEALSLLGQAASRGLIVAVMRFAPA